jgi:hypothetical protein
MGHRTPPEPLLSLPRNEPAFSQTALFPSFQGPAVEDLKSSRRISENRGAPTLATWSTVVILNGWKEIANHLGRGVRTIQRWESLGLPVRRPKRTDRSAVCAFSEEIDEWLRSAPSSPKAQVAQAPAKNLVGLFPRASLLSMTMKRSSSPPPRHCRGKATMSGRRGTDSKRLPYCAAAFPTC